MRFSRVIVSMGLFCGVCLLLTSAFWMLVKPRHMPQTFPRLVVGNRVIQLEIADSPLEQTKGLSGRTSLAPNVGMLFVFPAAGVYPFWMKDTLIPLDILWISQGSVVDMVTLQPERNGLEIPRHEPRAAADSVLELNAGEAKRLGLQVGSRVIILK